MTTKQRKRIVLIVIGVAVLGLVAYGFAPRPAAVEVAQAVRGPLQVVVEEEGTTQVADRYVVSAPAAAFLRRIELKAGDAVARGQAVAALEPPRSAILDPRSAAEARARVAAAEAALAQAQQQARGAAAAAERAAAEHERVQRLFELGSATEQQVEQARAEARQSGAAREAAAAAARAAEAEGVAARAALQPGGPAPAGQPVEGVLRSPVAGRVLAVRRESAGAVGPGEALVELGDTDHLEVRVDVLSQDAVRLTPGARVLFEQWGGTAALEGAVARIEPEGFTEVSSLGVEEQRVAVVANLTSPPAERAGLGAGYRVLARFVVWEGADVLQVPTGALFRTDDGWAVFVVEDGVARRRAVEVGHQTGLAAEVVSGLAPGDAVVVHPANDLADGARVKPR